MGLYGSYYGLDASLNAADVLSVAIRETVSIPFQIEHILLTSSQEATILYHLAKHFFFCKLAEVESNIFRYELLSNKNT